MFRCNRAALTLTLALLGFAAAATRADTPTPPAEPTTDAATPAAAVPVPAASAATPGAEAARASGKATIVFMRPSMLGGPVASSLFEIVDGKTVLVGILRSKQRVPVEVGPGTHFFMVMGESADFMTAEVAADKTYYALVTPRMGVWKARFSLRPVHQAELDSKQFGDWKYACALVERQTRDDDWAATNAGAIEEKRAKYLPEWQKKTEAERPALLAADGR